MAAEDGVGDRPAGRAEVEIPTFRVVDQAVGDKPSEHLAGGLGW